MFQPCLQEDFGVISQYLWCQQPTAVKLYCYHWGSEVLYFTIPPQIFDSHFHSKQPVHVPSPDIQWQLIQKIHTPKLKASIRNWKHSFITGIHFLWSCGKQKQWINSRNVMKFLQNWLYKSKLLKKTFSFLTVFDQSENYNHSHSSK